MIDLQLLPSGDTGCIGAAWSRGRPNETAIARPGDGPLRERPFVLTCALALRVAKSKMSGRGLPAPLFSTPDAPAYLGCCPGGWAPPVFVLPCLPGSGFRSVSPSPLNGRSGGDRTRTFLRACARPGITRNHGFHVAVSLQFGVQPDGSPVRVAATVNLVIKPVAAARAEKPSRHLYLGPFPRRAPFGLAVLSRRSLWLNGTPPCCFVGWGCLSILHHGA